MKGAALFLNSLVGCQWGEDDQSKQLNQTLRWGNKITYSGNFIVLEGNGVKLEGPKVDIATDTYDFVVKNSQEPLQVGILRTDFSRDTGKCLGYGEGFHWWHFVEFPQKYFLVLRYEIYCLCRYIFLLGWSLAFRVPSLIPLLTH